MSDSNNKLKVKAQGKFDGLLNGLASAQAAIRRQLEGLIGRRSKHRASQRPIKIRAAERHEKERRARRARRLNRKKATKRPKGKRKS